MYLGDSFTSCYIEFLLIILEYLWNYDNTSENLIMYLFQELFFYLAILSSHHVAFFVLCLSSSQISEC